MTATAPALPFSHVPELHIVREGELPAPVCTPVIYRRCAWHGGWIGVRAGDHPSVAGTVSDTICPTCRARMSDPSLTVN